MKRSLRPQRGIPSRLVRDQTISGRPESKGMEKKGVDGRKKFGRRIRGVGQSGIEKALSLENSAKQEGKPCRSIKLYN